MPTLSYGEDGLTYWALSGHRQQFLHALNDPTNAAESLFIFRPSFGRGGRNSGAPFGEFDAIVATAHRLYLVETKWDGSSSVIGEIPVIQSVQLRRHKIFRWVIGRWVEQKPNDWAAFAARNGRDFSSEFSGKPIAPPGSKLADNIECYLLRLASYSSSVEDILLYFHREGQRVRDQAAIAVGFRVVPFVYRPLNRGGIFDVEGGVEPEHH